MTQPLVINWGPAEKYFKIIGITYDIGKAVYETVANTTYGMKALAGAVGSVSTALANVAAVTGTPGHAGTGVSLPASPATGYLQAIAQAVWSYQLSNGYETGEVLADLGRWNDLKASGIGVAFAARPYILARFNWSSTGPFPVNDPPALDVSTIQDTDADVGAWLQRTQSGWTWQQDADTGLWWTFENFSNGAFYYCQIDAAFFDYLKHYQYTPASGPPMRSTLGDLATIQALIPVQYS